MFGCGCDKKVTHMDSFISHFQGRVDLASCPLFLSSSHPYPE